MQQAGVIRVLHVLQVQLPVGFRVLPCAAEVFDRLAENAVDIGTHFRADILCQLLHRVAERGEHQAAVAVHPQLAQIVLLGVEVARHPRHVLLAAAERHALQVAGRAVVPLVVDAAVVGGVAAGQAADHGAAVGAAVEPGSERALGRARHHHGGGADEGGLEVAGVGDLRFQAEEAPGRAFENALLLECGDLGRAEHGVGHAGAVRVGEAGEGGLRHPDRRHLVHGPALREESGQAG